jgi:hypothetical protein
MAQATNDEVRSIAKKLLLNKVFVDDDSGFNPFDSDSELPGVFLTPDQRNKAYIPVETIEAAALTEIQQDLQAAGGLSFVSSEGTLTRKGIAKAQRLAAAKRLNDALLYEQILAERD